MRKQLHYLSKTPNIIYVICDDWRKGLKMDEI